MKVKSFKELKVWQQGIILVKDLYKTTQSFPSSEMYGLTAQMRRAAISIPSNIAEGFSRNHTKEYTQFMHVALGSCAELCTQVVIANELKYLAAADMERLEILLDGESRMLMGLIKRLNQLSANN